MILGVPTLHRYDLLDELICSAERGRVKPSRYIIIDNGGGYEGGDRSHTWMDAATARGAAIEIHHPGRNLGVAASWNRILSLAEGEPVLISNDDVILGETTVGDFEEAVKTLPFVIASTMGFALFAMTKECQDTVGLFDEKFWPAYYEDIDYHRRVMLSGIRNGSVPDPVSHGVASTRESLSKKDAAFIHDGFRTNAIYYATKWGGERGEERFALPFDRKHAPSCLEDSLERPLRELLPILQHRMLRSTYFGVPAAKNPLDSWIYQELIHRTRPDVIVEIGNSYGGGALALAHLCDLLGHGRVIGVDLSHHTVPELVRNHPRITFIDGDACESYEKVAALIRPDETALVIEDSSHTYENTLAVLRAYSPLVKPGGYLIVEDGICRHGLDIGPDTGPYEAVETFTAEDERFIVDRSLEGFLITWNPKGFLRRV